MTIERGASQRPYICLVNEPSFVHNRSPFTRAQVIDEGKVGLFDGTPLERPVVCERCGLDIKYCSCVPDDAEAEVPETEPGKQSLTVRVERRKRGKLMTVISGFEGSQRQRQQVLRALKDRCGAGGTLAGLHVELQGDHVESVRDYLHQSGFKLAK